MNSPKLELYHFSQNGAIPNHPALPLLVYRQVKSGAEGLEKAFKQIFTDNNWGGSWTNGVYNYHHYHSTAHEVLGVCGGKATLIFGGPDNQEVEVSIGDMIVIPAGVGHCCKWASEDFKVIGAYPAGQEDYDICTEKDDMVDKKKNIEKVALPLTDPVYGASGPLTKEWR